MKRTYGAVITLIITFVISLNFGATKLNNLPALIFGNGSDTDLTIFQDIRLPRVLAALFVGATLGIGGALAQGALRNPLAEPVLLGTSGGAAFAVLLGILFLHISLGTPLALLFGVLGALISTLITFNLGKSGNNGFAFVVIGIAVSALLIALVGITAIMINKPEAQGVTFWSLGTLSMSTKSNIALLAPILIPTWILSWLYASKLDYLALGDIRATHLGIDVKRVRLNTFILISISIGSITSIFGQISFLALATPHIVRAINGPRHRALVLNSGIYGAIILVVADLFARSAAKPNELPIGLMTALIGAPVLVLMVRKWVRTHA